MNSADDFIAGLIVGVILASVLGLVTFRAILEDFKTTAVELDHAIWIVEPNGDTEFSWLIHPECE